MIPMSPQPAGLPSGTIGGRRRAARAHVAGSGTAAAVSLRAGAGLLGGLLVWWLASLVVAAMGGRMQWAVPPALAHALVLLAAPLPALLAGLALDRMPRWQQQPALAASAARLPVAGLVAGGLLAWTGSHVSVALAATGLALSAAGLALLTGRLALVWADSGTHRRAAGLMLLLGLGTLALSVWAAAVALALGSPQGARVALAVALWAGVGPVLLVLALRGLSEAARRQTGVPGLWAAAGLLAGLAALVAAQAPFAAAAVDPMTAAASGGLVALVRAGVGLAGGALLMWLALAHGLRQTVGPAAAARATAAERRWTLLLLAGLFWLAVSFTLDGVSQLLQAGSDGRRSLGPAALQAYTLGCIGSWLLALATQTLQAGRPERAPTVDRWTAVLAAALQAAALFSVLAALYPAARTALTLLAAQFAAVVALTWALRQARQA